MGILNVKEEKSLLSKNFFFLGTVFVIMLNFIMFNYFNEPIEFDQINNWEMHNTMIIDQCSVPKRVGYS